MDANQVRESIKKFRLIKGYSQEYMASQLGVTQSAYAKLENNPSKITLRQLSIISSLLEVCPSNIFLAR